MHNYQVLLHFATFSNKSYVNIYLSSALFLTGILKHFEWLHSSATKDSCERNYPCYTQCGVFWATGGQWWVNLY